MSKDGQDPHAHGTALPPPPLHLPLTSDPANLVAVRREVEAFCSACGFGEPARGQIVLCVNEALANVTRHAYGGAVDRPVHLDVSFADGVLRVRIRDWGIGRVPPECLPPRDPLQPGGIGLVCLRNLMDRVDFDPQADGMLLTMERRR